MKNKRGWIGIIIGIILLSLAIKNLITGRYVMMIIEIIGGVWNLYLFIPEVKKDEK